MKLIFSFFMSLFILTACTTEQLNQSINLASQVYGQTPPNTSEISLGLKQALEFGANAASSQLSQPNGFLKNAAVKVLLPPEARNAEKRLRQLGLGKVADEAILSMNRAAESAASKAAPILVQSIKSMTIADAKNILFGADNAATAYLKRTTSSQLTTAFAPIVKNSTSKTKATKYWNDFAKTYNQIPFATPITADINSYITQQTLKGLFSTIAIEENKIRKDPLQRSTDLLKRVFGYATSQK